MTQEAMIRSSDDPIIRSSTLSISSLTLSHFRNYTSLRLELSGAPVVLAGHNGAGKTNILEAVSLLAPGRGLRRAKLAEMNLLNSSPHRGEVGLVRHSLGDGGRGASLIPSSQVSPHPNPPPMGEGKLWAIAARAQGMQGEVAIGTGCASAEEGGDRRIVKIDGTVAAQAELAEHLAIVWLTPQMDQLFMDSASAGRKFLDRLTYNFDAGHVARINQYDYAMRERNRLLEQGGRDGAWLDALEQTMAETAAAIAAARLATAAHINHAILASPLSFPKAQVGVEGMVEQALREERPAIEVEDFLKRTLAQNRRQDAAAGRALVGVHRSALQVMHMAKAMPAAACSTGEQKALLLSIILAQARAAASWKGVTPIVLLDEVIAHLDMRRKLELFEEICQIGAQVWMTGTDADLFAELGSKAQLFKVDNATVTA